MPAPSVNRVRVQFGGAIGASRWTSAMWAGVAAGGPPSQSNLDTCASAMLTTFNSNTWADLRALNQATTTLTDCRVDFYLAGSQASAGNGVANQTASPGTSTGKGAASQAIVASLYSATASRRGRGRMYLPATGGLDGTTNPYGFSTSIATTLALDISVLCANLTTISGTDFGAGVGASVQSITDGMLHPIVTVLVDTRPDRQEHREKSIVFSRFAHAV